MTSNNLRAATQDDAGARYFILTTKHHDGYALFDTKESSNRNSLRYGPKEDLLKKLFTAAEQEQPQLHRGTYFSMPEWFAPAYHPLGKVLFVSSDYNLLVLTENLAFCSQGDRRRIHTTVKPNRTPAK